MNSLEHGLEVSEAQEELVRLNLRIKTTTVSFVNGDCSTHRQMEQLNSDIRNYLEKMKRTLDRLRHLAERQSSSESRKMLLSDVDKYADQLAACHRSFRQANLRCIGELERKGREDLFTNDTEDHEGIRKRQKQKEKEGLVTQSGKATDNLASISRQLAETVERSAETVGTLAESSQTVNETKDEFQGMGSIIGQSRRLITKFARREVTDRVLILFAVAFYFSVVLYILRKRVFGPFDPVAIAWSTIKTLVIALVKIIQTVQKAVIEAFT